MNATGADGGIGNFMPHLTEAARLSNGFVLEIGAGVGDGSIAAFANGLEQRGGDDRLHISVDIKDRLRDKPEVPYWYYIIGDSREPETAEMVKTVAGGRIPGVLFIDTDHYYEHMARELEVWKVLAGEETVWLFHDTWIWGIYNHMTEAIKEFAVKEGWVYDDWSTEIHGLGRMRKCSITPTSG
jgi:cephalosporin hydroxylase